MQTAYSVEPSLPFVLLDRPTPPGDLSTVVLRLDALQVLMEDARSELHELRNLNAQLVELVATPPTEPPSPPEAAPVERDSRAATSDAPALSVSLLGGFKVRAGGEAIEGWRSRKARLLFAYLALDPTRAVTREALIEEFWPESAPSRGANNLSIAVHHVRSRLAPVLPDEDGARGIDVQQGLYRLDPNLPWVVDVAEFRAGVARAKAADGGDDEISARRALERALDIYRGDLLDSDLVEEWTLEPRQELVSLFQWAAGWLAADSASRGEWGRVLELGDALLHRDGADEAGHGWLTRAHLAMGNRAQAIRQLATCVERLREEFGVGPSRETRELLADLELDPA